MYRLRIMVPDYNLDTPEAISIRYNTAGIGTRFLAAALDFLIWVVLAAVLLLGAAALGAYGVAGHEIALILLGTLAFFILYAYYIVFETLWQGQTPGKRVLKIRVIRRDGQPIGFFEAFIRNVVRVVDFLPVFYGVGVITMFVSKESRRLGDYAAGTIVVLEDPVTIDEITLAPPRAQPALGVVDPDELNWDVRALRPDDLVLIRRYMQRSAQLPPAARAEVGTALAERVASRIGARSPLDPTHFVERVLYLREQGRVDGPR